MSTSIGAVPEVLQTEIDITLGAQHRDQGIGADQQVGPERQDHQQQQNTGLARGGAKVMAMAMGNADHQADQSGHPGEPERLEEDLEIERIQGPGVVVQHPGNVDVHQAVLFAES